MSGGREKCESFWSRGGVPAAFGDAARDLVVPKYDRHGPAVCALIADYARYVDRFDAIAEYLTRRPPPSLMLWGRHDAFFDIAETLSWMQALPRMEAHVLDGGHRLLETHAAAAAALMLNFIERTQPR